ncbi:MAG TPA: type II toxin-antitoxin system HicB family antitoxin [Daejeonella sp.]|nr:type II toxin-antitoxin system HicB family antitoxin [Daejeonella sp.]
MESRYEIILYWSNEDNAFIAEALELSGCIADVATYTEALQNIQIIISHWLETAKELGRNIPKPKGRLASA